jgi:lysophospholipase L1-like esterase
LFFEKAFSSYHVLIKDSTGQELAVAGAFSEEEYRNTSKIVLPYAIHQLQLETTQFLPGQRQFTFFGMSLSNSKPGILYSIIGANGAKFKHFSASKELLYQTQALAPDLIIITLGTNEAVDHPDLDPKFDSDIDSLIRQLTILNPNATILLTTPPDFYKKRTLRNPGIKIIKDKIIEYADLNHMPYWNLYEIGGGHRSADQWKTKHLLQNDGIHFTKKGYDVQGHLLFEAILKGYHEYVRDRLPETH